MMLPPVYKNRQHEKAFLSRQGRPQEPRGGMAINRGRMVHDQHSSRMLGQHHERPSKAGDTPGAVPTRACIEQRSCELRLRQVCLLIDKSATGPHYGEARRVPGRLFTGTAASRPVTREANITAAAHTYGQPTGATEATPHGSDDVATVPQRPKGLHDQLLAVSRGGSGTTLEESYLPTVVTATGDKTPILDEEPHG
ncbi:hypothetical protein GGTG_06239 [Gaeumannomyces tritici R3-111a-1]|uniref:Uncharacterized protein n=1 Tax=Gaeumannomyces tritici (strain R3-111a-1) TaxID=644352 RepID=J3NY86_GAET3|nr:hypothetical protein GGTG_06239 [Gaeumannomyces tritici R3-111a-1]EJT76319.1 hypothetical protein GGTG_06239 [Gaeumannomyces tritici R3-111a-1]